MSDSNWSRRRFLGAGLIACGAALVPLVPTAWDRDKSIVTRRRELWAMGGWNYLEATAVLPGIAAAALDVMAAEIRDVDGRFSVFDSRSILSQFNDTKSLSVPIDDPLVFKAVSDALRCARLLDGAFDPTVEPLMSRMGFRDDPNAVVKISSNFERDWGYEGLQCDWVNGRILRNAKTLSIDPGGWAKGLAAERAALAAMGAGAVTAKVSCGGDLYRCSRDRMTTWTCSIRNPTGGRGDVVAKIRHRFATVATSGANETYRVATDGKRIGHLMDPRLGRPSEGDLLSVTVFGSNGLSTDAVSSGLFVMGKSEAIRWLGRNPEFGAVLIDDTWPDSRRGITVVGELEIV